MNKLAYTLLEWYKLNKRDLPWRNTRDPYKIWISEIILQQTRVVQGLDYYLRFVKRFPNFQSLAEADEDEVMKLWQGLGYYSRARNLHSAAKSIKGSFPKEYKDVLSLKGVGKYTAAAICSFAYHQPYAVLDGNVYRVLSRYFGEDIPIDTTEGQKFFEALSQDELPMKNGHLYNQAIMDFGAMQCTPVAPDCSVCPLVSSCVAFATGRVAELPVKSKKVKVTDRYFNYVYIEYGEYIYIYRRDANDIWKNLYEFPLIETDVDEDAEHFLASDQLASLVGKEHLPLVRCIKSGVKHVLTHRRIYVNLYQVCLLYEPSALSKYLKIKKFELDAYPLSRLLDKLWKEVK